MRVAIAEGAEVVVGRPGALERHGFATPEAAARRAAFVAEALTWLGTPFLDCADVKGPGGAVDCAMLLVRCAVDGCGLPPFDPRPYPPRWHLHRSEERFLNIVERDLGCRRVETPRVGDIVLWQFGRTFSHGAVLIGAEEVCHAYYAAGEVVVSRLHEPLLDFISDGRVNIPRPVLYFDLWGG
jgi:cell wall-associated NlpC family hydrolase